ncbi:hypothetical protein M0R45_029023 [Rubus argutus]|uniref:Uncharacterized protein n=1 Tax=Rubus argutus TaxID=59490 RepID=A0AAW1W799_RUBAR
MSGTAAVWQEIGVWVLRRMENSLGRVMPVVGGDMSNPSGYVAARLSERRWLGSSQEVPQRRQLWLMVRDAGLAASLGMVIESGGAGDDRRGGWAW